MNKHKYPLFLKLYDMIDKGDKSKYIYIVE